MSQPKIKNHSGIALVGGICSCNLCPKTFAAAPQALLIGATQSENQNRAVLEFSLQLLQHIINDHPIENQALEMESTQFLSMRRLQYFRLNDPGIRAEIEKIRWSIHQATAAAQLTDAAIAGAADEYAEKMMGELGKLSESEEEVTSAQFRLKLKSVYREIMMEMLTSTRQLLVEPDKYPRQVLV